MTLDRQFKGSLHAACYLWFTVLLQPAEHAGKLKDSLHAACYLWFTVLLQPAEHAGRLKDSLHAACYLWFTVLLQPAEHAGRQLGKVGHWDGWVEWMKEGVHDLLKLKAEPQREGGQAQVNASTDLKTPSESNQWYIRPAFNSDYEWITSYNHESLTQNTDILSKNMFLVYAMYCQFTEHTKTSTFIESPPRVQKRSKDIYIYKHKQKNSLNKRKIKMLIKNNKNVS